MSDSKQHTVVSEGVTTPAKSEENLSSTDNGRVRPNRDFGTQKTFFRWFDPNDSPLERRVITKLDLFILGYAFIGFWVLYIDRGITANAYVSGMREDLRLFGNELVQLNSLHSAGYCLSMIPATLLVTKYPANYVIPSCMFLWGIFTLLFFRAQSFNELLGYRFLMGFLQGPYFCSIHYVLGSWYRGDELVRRAGIFYMSSGLGTMSTSVLAARIYASLNGALGHAGWRWMYVIASIMTFPVAFWGFATFPGTPKDGKRWFFTQEEFDLAKERMRLEGRLQPKGASYSFATVKRFLYTWQFWVLVPWNILWVTGYGSMNQGPILWFRSIKEYSTVDVNNYSAVSPSIGILWIWIFAWLVDKGGKKAIVPVVGFACGLHFVAKFAWIFYDQTPFGYKWFAAATAYIEVSLSPINYSVANLACAGDAELRAFIVSSMLALSTANNLWIQILAFPTSEGPRFFKGYVFEAVQQVTYTAWTAFVVWLVLRTEKKKEGTADVESESTTTVAP